MISRLENRKVFLSTEDVSKDVLGIEWPKFEYGVEWKSEPSVAGLIPHTRPHAFKLALAVLDLSPQLRERLKDSIQYQHITVTALMRQPDGTASDMVAVLRGPSHTSDEGKLIVDVESFLLITDGKPSLLLDRAMAENNDDEGATK